VKFDHNDASSCCPAFYNNVGSHATMTDVIFDRNTAGHDTGAMFSEGTDATLRNVTFSRNHSDAQGGALISQAGTLNLTDATFSGNSAGTDGGAIETATGSTTNLNDVTIVRNTADADDDGSGDGGGIHLQGGTLNIQNSILAANTDRGGEAPNCAPGLISDGHNLFGQSPGCLIGLGNGDLFPPNPRLASLADNGGFTRTVALKRHSPAINHGSSSPPGSGGESCAKRDQRGVKRPRGPRCDIGAFERRPRRPH